MFKENVKLSIIPINMKGEPLHEDLHIHVTSEECILPTIRSFVSSNSETMAWITLISERGISRFHKKGDGTITDNEGYEVIFSENADGTLLVRKL